MHVVRVESAQSEFQDNLMGHAVTSVRDVYGASQAELKVAVVSSLEFMGHVDDSVYLPGELVNELRENA